MPVYSDQERVRDYHARECRLWLKFAQPSAPADRVLRCDVGGLLGVDVTTFADAQAHYHATQAAHWSRLAELIPAVKEQTAQAASERRRQFERTTRI